MRPRRWSRSATARGAAVAVVVLLVTGVVATRTVDGGGDGSVPDVAATTTTTVPANLDDVAFGPGDFPPGWSADPTNQDEDAGTGIAGGLGGTTGCAPAGIDPSLGRTEDEDQSIFTTGGGFFALAGSLAVAADDGAVAEATFDFATSEAFGACAVTTFADGVREESGRGLEIVADETRPLAIIVAAEESVARRTRLTGRQPGLEIPLFVDLVVLRSGRGVALAVFGSANQPVDAELQQRLVAGMAERLAAALTPA